MREGDVLRVKDENTETWDLKEIIDALSEEHPEIEELYLFGSRAYKTNSLRSDIDILAFTDGVLAPHLVNEWLHDEYPLVDLFTSYDKTVASSVVNGSVVRYRNDGKSKDLIDQLDAVFLWSKSKGYSNKYKDWHIKTAKNISFQMSIIPSYPVLNSDETLRVAVGNLEASGIKSYFAGSTWGEIADSITKMVEEAMVKPMKYQKRAKSFSFDTIKIEDEYDFQNMILAILRPVYPDINPENFMINIDGADKKADFGISNNRIVIEAKWISDKGKEADVLKTLEGLEHFYLENSNVKCLIFLILYKSNLSIDEKMLEYKFSYEKSTPKIIVRFIKNEFE